MPENTTSPFTIAPAHLTATAAYRLPQLLAALGDWLKAEAAAGRLADDHHRPPDQFTALIRAAISQTTDQTDNLATAPQHRAQPDCHPARPAA